MKVLLILFTIYSIVAFIFGCLIGLPDNPRSVRNSIIMGIVMIFYPIIIILNKIKKLIL